MLTGYLWVLICRLKYVIYGLNYALGCLKNLNAYAKENTCRCNKVTGSNMLVGSGHL